MLGLRDNHIGPVGTQYLAYGLQHNRTLTTLDLRNNQIGDVGAQYVADALQHNTTLTTLILYVIQIREDFIREINKFLERNKIEIKS
ncbi:unnamed protein product [Adineta steineri]|uniref:Uncharacterized protein n=1 Tax=Adineta steineri TaxID=433720 RepID=A0A814NAX5_9BILA|nr:unnamed protein product [Adineta steineri]CAF1182440.1 unnamed protein product [Adineta steineri]